MNDQNKNTRETIIFVDGAYLRKILRKNQYFPDAESLKSVIMASAGSCGDLRRIFFYDCEPFTGKLPDPPDEAGDIDSVSRTDFSLKYLKREPKIMVRLGLLKFRGWKQVSSKNLNKPLYKPEFQQKGVDVQLALDMVSACSWPGGVRNFVLIAKDTDLLPAMEMVRNLGQNLVLVVLEGESPSDEMIASSDELHRVSFKSLNLTAYKENAT
ncbi:NYN domain-containing protein [Candidatus Haliotispira prima]|uniref:NYN domain-containing protein n=1 Tax=Candidatus Haliotispira prima TaxID=3034016 RepID=A0ABY8MGP4_9SPIO|nr:NYN domain-containing protein [Candidatus Haliotispira prima]